VRSNLEGNVLAADAREGRYVREATVGRGACGVVYRARDTVLGRTVAIKVIRFDPSMSDDGRHEMAVRSEREARAASARRGPPAC
jgi:serine/threonine protein kinase